MLEAYAASKGRPGFRVQPFLDACSDLKINAP